MSILDQINRTYARTIIIESVNALEKTDVPIRQHLRKRWMRENYHERIQKKWTKRWGFVMKPAIFITPMGYVVHPSLTASVRRCTQVQPKNGGFYGGGLYGW